MIKFLNKMFSSADDTSSKRVMGTLGFLTFLTLTCFVVLRNTDLTASAENILNTTGYISGALLGIGILDKGVSAIVNKLMK